MLLDLHTQFIGNSNPGSSWGAANQPPPQQWGGASTQQAPQQQQSQQQPPQTPQQQQAAQLNQSGQQSHQPVSKFNNVTHWHNSMARQSIKYQQHPTNGRIYFQVQQPQQVSQSQANPQVQQQAQARPPNEQQIPKPAQPG